MMLQGTGYRPNPSAKSVLTLNVKSAKVEKPYQLDN